MWRPQKTPRRCCRKRRIIWDWACLSTGWSAAKAASMSLCFIWKSFFPEARPKRGAAATKSWPNRKRQPKCWQSWVLKMADAFSSQTRCGFVALIGAPNAGKSTITNNFVGSKVSIVSPKVQTTRTLVKGIGIYDADNFSGFAWNL